MPSYQLVDVGLALWVLSWKQCAMVVSGQAYQGPCQLN